MNRRIFLTKAASATALFAGCIGNDESESADGGTNGASESPEYDALIDYTTHVQDEVSGNYELPEPVQDNWSWIVVDFEVLEGQLDMEDVWFNGLFETAERYYTVSKQTGEAENGIEPRGAVKQGSQGVILFEYPPSPASNLAGPIFSATDTSIGGEEIETDGPDELYPPVTVEYSVETLQNPEILSDEFETDQGNEWAVVNLAVIEGVLNMEDVWFRSQLSTDSRVYEIDHTSQFANRGVRSRGLVKQGNSANALYQIAEDESVDEWGYQEDNRQEITINRA